MLYEVITEMTYFTVKEVVEALSADVIVGQANVDKVVEGMFIGAMTVETALKYMRRHRRKAIITGGDRSDIQLAALSTDTRITSYNVCYTKLLRASRSTLSWTALSTNLTFSESSGSMRAIRLSTISDAAKVS